MIHTLVKAWSGMGHRVSLFSPGDWSCARWSEQRHGDVVLYKQRLRMPFDRRRSLKGMLGWLREFPGVFLKFRRFVLTQQVDIIHLHTPRDYQFYFRLLGMVGGPPYVLTFHGTDALCFASGRQRDNAWLKWIVRGAAGVTAVSKSYSSLIEKNHPDLAPVRYIPNGIHMDNDQSLDSLRWDNARLKTLPEKYCVIVGWVEPPKAQDVAVRAWGLLKRLRPDLHLLIIGDQPLLSPGEPYYPGYIEGIRQMIFDHGCADTVHWVGSLHQTELYFVLKRAYGLVFPSKREGLPYVLLEAGILKLPAVCTDIPAFADLITHGENGLLFPDDDHEAMAAFVDQIAGDTSFAERLGNGLYATVKKQFTAEMMAQSYLDLFRGVGRL